MCALFRELTNATLVLKMLTLRMRTCSVSINMYIYIYIYMHVLMYNDDSLVSVVVVMPKCFLPKVAMATRVQS